MDYLSARNLISTGDCISFEGRGSFPFVIRRYQRIHGIAHWRVTHIGMAMWVAVNGVRRLAMLEAVEGRGVQLVPLSLTLRSRLSRGAVAYWQPLQGVDREKLLSSALRRWGGDYVNPVEFVRSFTLIGRSLSRWMGLPEQLAPKRVFCSQNYALSLAESGFVLPTLPSQTPPGEVVGFSCLGDPTRLDLAAVDVAQDIAADTAGSDATPLVRAITRAEFDNLHQYAHFWSHEFRNQLHGIVTSHDMFLKNLDRRIARVLRDHPESVGRALDDDAPAVGQAFEPDAGPPAPPATGQNESAGKSRNLGPRVAGSGSP